MEGIREIYGNNDTSEDESLVTHQIHNRKKACRPLPDSSSDETEESVKNNEKGCERLTFSGTKRKKGSQPSDKVKLTKKTGQYKKT